MVGLMEGAAAAGVSSLVKFSEVFLWDDVMEGNEKGYSQGRKKYFLSDDEDGLLEGDEVLKLGFLENDCDIVMEEVDFRPNKKTYFHSDEEDVSAVKDGDSVPKVDFMESGCEITMEAELTQQMNMMGLPLSFNSSKQVTNGSHQGSRKSTHLKFSQGYRNYADAMAETGSFRVSAVNMCDPESTYLELKEFDKLTSTVTSEDKMEIINNRDTYLATDDHPALTECSLKNIKTILSNDLGIGPATVQSYPAEPDAIILDNEKDSDDELDHEYIRASGTSDHSGEAKQFSNGVEKFMVASDQSSDVVNDSGWLDNICYGEFEDWRIYWDNGYQLYYYFNINTTESTWEPPPGMEHQLHNDMVITQECVVDDCISGIDGKLGDEANPPDETGCCVTCGQNIVSSEMSIEFDINMCPDCKLSWEVGENFGKASSVRKNKKSRRSRVWKTSSCTVKGDVTKYWCQRYYLFSRFDEGIKMDKEGWYSVTPEKIAEHHASRCGAGVVLDLFTGVGGNAIQFAQRGEHVIAVDIDPHKIDYARHNAAIYGVTNWIDFIQGNSFAIAHKLKADTVFLSPPWGGPDYVRSEVYDLKTMLKPYDGYYLFNAVKHIAPHIVMFLPRNVDVGQLVELAVTSTPPWSLEVEKNFLNGKLKAVTAYFRATETVI